MNKLRIPQNHSGVSKTLRLPENIVDDVQNLANLKNLSFNKIVISLLEFGLSNLDEKDYEKLKKFNSFSLEKPTKSSHFLGSICLTSIKNKSVKSINSFILSVKATIPRCINTGLNAFSFKFFKKFY